MSATAPYRHYEDRDALVSAVAAEGHRELAQHLAAAHPAPSTPEDLAAVSVARVRFALDRPALFRAMFAGPSDPTDEERVAATAVITEYVRGLVREAFPGADETGALPSAEARRHDGRIIGCHGRRQWLQ